MPDCLEGLHPEHPNGKKYHNSKSQGKNTDIIQFFMERDYDIEIEPPINPETSNYTNVYIHLTCNYMNLVDERSILVLNGELLMHWEDSRMTWSAEEYGRQHFDFDSFEVWTPEVVLRNNAYLNLEIYNIRYSKVRVYSNGTSFWKRAVHFTAFCKGIDHHKWPKDKHVCELQLGLIGPYGSLQMIPLKDWIHLDESRIHKGWDIEKMNVKTKWIPSFKNIKKDLDAMNNPKPNHIIIEFNLSRSYNFYYSALMIFLATISILTLLSFWASPLGLLKVGIQCFTLVIVSLSVMFCWKVIPNHNNKDFPSVFSAFIVIMHMVWVSIASSVVLSSFIFFAPVSIPSSVSGFLKSKFLAMFFCLPQPSNKVAMYYNRLCDGSILSKEDSQGYSFKSKECELQWNWILISIIIERILFCTYIGLFCYVFSLLN
ncbi:acetylcholine receptor subunit alpha-like 1 [Hetaerina americana]|uniref:acetylcholine receptor subunit alpha-like 1 n=1 Tax=Hetaerina americana TaxID=62018 RepID=UPI003A7F323C